jgi:PAT family beta-lactamase induction signal transducer AmpG
MMAIAAVTSASGFTLFWVVASLFAVLHATHDIACDGFYIQALDRKDQALYAGVRVAAFRIAMILGSSLLVKYVATVSWFLAFGAAAAAMLATALINVFVMPRPPTPTEVPKVASKGPAFWTAYRTFLQQPQAVLVLSFMFLYRLGDIMMFAMSKPLLRDIGVDLGHRGTLNGWGTFVFIVGGLAGGAVIARLGLRRTLVPMLYLQNLAIPLYVLLAVVKPAFGTVVLIVLVEQLVSGIGNAGHVVFLIQRSRGVFSASHYAFATAVVSLGSTLSGYVSGPLNQHFGHPIFFTIAFVASWPALVLVWFVPKSPVEASGHDGAAGAA